MKPGFQHPITVKPTHIDQMGHVNNVVYLQWVQDTAAAHWLSAAHPEDVKNYRWVVLRHEIDYHKPAFEGEKLTGHTWVEKMEGVKSYRWVEIRRGDQVLARALTTWCLLDARTGRPARVSEGMCQTFL